MITFPTKVDCRLAQGVKVSIHFCYIDFVFADKTFTSVCLAVLLERALSVYKMYFLAFS